MSGGGIGLISGGGASMDRAVAGNRVMVVRSCLEPATTLPLLDPATTINAETAEHAESALIVIVVTRVVEGVGEC